MVATNRQPAERRVKPSTYQPSKADMEEEIDMPGADMNTLRDAFFKPVKKEDREIA